MVLTFVLNVLASIALVLHRSECRPLGRDDTFVGWKETVGSLNQDEKHLIPNPACIDEEDETSCKRWAAQGECSRNADFMTTSCRKSCAECVPFIQKSEYYGKNLTLSTPYGQAGGFGPPYGLLQGVCSNLQENPAKELSTKIRRGSVATIHPGKDFYISLMDHFDWSLAHTTWGVVEDMSAVEALVNLPYTENRHPHYGTVMRMMKPDVNFALIASPEVQLL